MKEKLEQVENKILENEQQKAVEQDKIVEVL
jgi:hypothetical protein